MSQDLPSIFPASSDSPFLPREVGYNVESIGMEKRMIELENKSSEEIKKLTTIMVGVVIVVVLAFIGFLIALIIGFYMIALDNIKEKDLYLEYIDLHENYSEKNYELKDKITSQNEKIIDLENKIENMKIKNYLK